MLVLGATRIFEPVNGYQLRQELLSWQVEDWANVQPGSIYSMLATLSKQGMLERIDLVSREGTRPVAVYRTTPEGRKQLLELVGASIREVPAMDSTRFYAAMSFVHSFFERAEVATLLGERLGNLRAGLVSLGAKISAVRSDPATPDHVAEVMDYSVRKDRAEIEWVEAYLASMSAGRFVFLGEEDSTPPIRRDDDPAGRIFRERELYAAALTSLGK